MSTTVESLTSTTTATTKEKLMTKATTSSTFAAVKSVIIEEKTALKIPATSAGTSPLVGDVSEEAEIFSLTTTVRVFLSLFLPLSLENMS
jgi:hypothetical protein